MRREQQPLQRQAGRVRAKARIWRALEAALVSSGSRCEALIGMCLENGEGTNLRPDVVVYCGQHLPDEATAVDCPVLVVEILADNADVEERVRNNFRLPSVQHCLLVQPDLTSAALHSRSGQQQTSSPFVLEELGATLRLPDMLIR